MIDPVEALLKASTTVGQILPTSTPTSVDPLPPIVPSIENQHVTKQVRTRLNRESSQTEDVANRTAGNRHSLDRLRHHASLVCSLRRLVPACPSGKLPFLSLLTVSQAYEIQSNRLYHVITTTITTIAAISYFMMATGQGIGIHETKIHEHHKHVDQDTETLIRRQVFWARYVDWTLTTPLLLLDLGILAGLSGAHILIAVIADIVMVLMGLFAAFGNEHTAQKWGDYTIAIIAFLVVIWHLALNGRNAVQARSQNVASFYTAIAVYTLVIWAAYPM
jgi:hypothetical protein